MEKKISIGTGDATKNFTISITAANGQVDVKGLELFEEHAKLLDTQLSREKEKSAGLAAELKAAKKPLVDAYLALEKKLKLAETPEATVLEMTVEAIGQKHAALEAIDKKVNPTNQLEGKEGDQPDTTSKAWGY